MQPVCHDCPVLRDRFATFISWLLTASLGAYMLRTWAGARWLPIARLPEEPLTSARRRPITVHPAVLIPVAHGFAAMGTFVLAVVTASM